MYDRYISVKMDICIHFYQQDIDTDTKANTKTKTGHSIYLYSIFLFYYLDYYDLDPLYVSIHTFFVIILASRIHDLPR